MRINQKAPSKREVFILLLKLQYTFAKSTVITVSTTASSANKQQ